MFKNKHSSPLRGKYNILAIFLIIIPIVLVFKKVLFGNLQTFGDAPFFYYDVISNLFSEPRAWTQRGVNFGGINQILWISPIMFIYGLIAHLFNLQNVAVVRIVFYIPAIVASVVTPYFLAKYLKFSSVTTFFTVFVYSVNTYFILLIDGGQVGVALAYGFFPLLTTIYKKLVDNPDEINSLFAFTLSIAYCSIDPRIYTISVILVLIWSVFEKKNVTRLVILQLPIVLCNLYWIYPLINSASLSINAGVAGLQTSSLLNSLLLYAPHWPNNAFGKIIAPTFYFVLVPFLLFGSYLIKPSSKGMKVIGILFLIFSFLSKGTTPPFGDFYNILVTKVPFGSAFRDSSKFFVPLMLLGGIMIGETASKFKGNLSKAVLYTFLLLIISPALFTKLNFNLSNRLSSKDFETLAIKFRSEDGFFRTVWFPTKSSISYESETKPAIDAADLVKTKSIEVINNSEDPFNFLNNLEFPNRLAGLGIKYLVLSGDTRNLNPSDSEIKNWDTINYLVSKNKNLKKLDVNTEFPVYEILNPRPEFYAVDSIVGVVGPYLNKDNTAIYFEDGKFDPKLLQDKKGESIKLFFNGKDEIDLTMSFLQKYFVGASNSVENKWAYYSSENILKAKYELLIRDIKYNDFDYGKGISFSTEKYEKIKFKLNVQHDGEYILAIRKMDKNSSFKWETTNLTAKKGSFDYEFENKNNIEVLNVVALVPKKDFDEAKVKTKEYIQKFGVLKNEQTNISFEKVEVENEGIGLMKFSATKSGYWLVLNDSYNFLWKMRKGAEYFNSLPINSEVNGFYFEPTWSNLHLEFEGQKDFRWGIYYSLLSLIATLIVLLFKYAKDN